MFTLLQWWFLFCREGGVITWSRWWGKTKSIPTWAGLYNIFDGAVVYPKTTYLCWRHTSSKILIEVEQRRGIWTRNGPPFYKIYENKFEWWRQPIMSIWNCHYIPRFSCFLLCASWWHMFYRSGIFTDLLLFLFNLAF